MMQSSSLYDTFGNEIKYQFTEGKLAAYFENATVSFALPEASTEILTKLTTETAITIDPTVLEQVIGQLKVSGFQEANALALADVIIRVAHAQGVHPLTYFDLNRNTVKFTVDAYRIVNDMRPPGSKINLVSQRNNQTSSPGRLIRP